MGHTSLGESLFRRDLFHRDLPPNRQQQLLSQVCALGAPRARFAQIPRRLVGSLLSSHLQRVVRVHFKRILPQIGPIRLADLLCFRHRNTHCDSLCERGKSVHRSLPLVHQVHLDYDWGALCDTCIDLNPKFVEKERGVEGKECAKIQSLQPEDRNFAALKIAGNRPFSHNFSSIGVYKERYIVSLQVDIYCLTDTPKLKSIEHTIYIAYYPKYLI